MAVCSGSCTACKAPIIGKVQLGNIGGRSLPICALPMIGAFTDEDEQQGQEL